MAALKRSGVAYGAVPKADLLPEAQRLERSHRRVVPRLALAVVLSAVVAAAIWAAGLLPIMQADQRLTLAEMESETLATQIGQYTDEQELIGTVNKITGERKQLAAGEVLFIELLDEIDRVRPSGSEIIGYTGRLFVEGAEAPDEKFGMDLNPLCVSEIATLTITFQGEDLAPAPAFIAKLEQLPGVACIVGTKITTENDEIPQAVTVQLALTEDALAQRFEEAAE